MITSQSKRATLGPIVSKNGSAIFFKDCLYGTRRVTPKDTLDLRDEIQFIAWSTRQMPKHYAHTKGSDPVNWEPLDEHLCLVAEYAERFAAKFDAAAWGKMLGLWHDLGKYSKEFQAYLAKSGNPDIHQSEVLGRVDHSTAGAVHATKQLGESARYRLKASKSSKLFKRLQK